MYMYTYLHIVYLMKFLLFLLISSIINLYYFLRQRIAFYAKSFVVFDEEDKGDETGEKLHSRSVVSLDGNVVVGVRLQQPKMVNDFFNEGLRWI